MAPPTQHRDHWTDHAACRHPDVDPTWFYPPDRDKPPTGRPRRADNPYIQAAQICAHCPVIQACHQDIETYESVKGRDAHGFWAGESANTRRRRRKLARLELAS